MAEYFSGSRKNGSKYYICVKNRQRFSAASFQWLWTDSGHDETVAYSSAEMTASLQVRFLHD